MLGNTNVRITNDVVSSRVRVSAAPSAAAPEASANLQLDAVTGSVNIGHNVLVQANALDNGTSFAQANASANILGHTNVVIAGNVDVIGTAQDHVSGGNQYAEASPICRFMPLTAASISAAMSAPMPMPSRMGWLRAG